MKKKRFEIFKNRLLWEIILLTVIIFFLVIGVRTLAARPVLYGDIKVSHLIRVYDGDTFYVDIDGWPDVVGRNVPIRLAGVDTPELRGKCPKEKLKAETARLFTVTMLANANVIMLRNIRRGKYFRLVADVLVDNVSLADELINKELAVPYTGGTKTKNWCN